MSVALGLSAVLLKPINLLHATVSHNSEVQLNDSMRTTALLDSTWTASGQRHVAHYTNGTNNIAVKKEILSGFANLFHEEEAAPVDKDIHVNTMGSVKPAASRITTQELYDPQPHDREIDPRAVEGELHVGEVAAKAADPGSTTNSESVRIVASRKQLREKVEESDGSMSQGRGSRVLNIQISDAEAQSSAMQRKLTQMWDCLQVGIIPLLTNL